jgi:hypothetical protein
MFASSLVEMRGESELTGTIIAVGIESLLLNLLYVAFERERISAYVCLQYDLQSTARLWYFGKRTMIVDHATKRA